MIQMFIQVAAGSYDRNVYDERTPAHLETRRGSQPYPYPYGFVIGTSAEDSGCVDCYLITRDRIAPGTIVECEPVGLLLQDEDGEMAHKILAALPDQEVGVGPELLQELQDFIHSIFAGYPVRVGPILSREQTLHHLQKSRPG
jgi:inorganic pyrophosphatase